MLPAIFRYWPSRRVHVSVLIAAACAGVAFGVGAARFTPAGMFMGPAWAVVAGLLGAFGIWRGRYYSVLFMVAAGLLLGLWRGSLMTADLAQYAPLYGHAVTVEGKVTDDPDTDAGGALVVKLGELRIDGRPYGGTVWASVATHERVKRSDQATVRGKLGAGFGTFAGTMYRAQLTGDSRVDGGDPARDLRDWFAAAIRRAVPEPEASLGVGYLVGQKSALPADLAAAFVVTGLTQAVVASGYNLTILVRLARRLFVRHSKYLATLAALLMVVGFVGVTGLSPSMTRAGLVSAISLLAWYYGRAVNPIVLLSLAAALTLLYNPGYAWGDLGWALSFSAFAGVMVLAPLLHAYFFGEAAPGVVRGLLVETVAATITTLPILVFSFGQFSNVSLPASLLVLPLIPLAMLLTFVAGIGALLIPPLAGLIGLPATWVLGYSIAVAKFFAGLSWATSTLTIGPLAFVGAYLVIVLACLYLRRATRGGIEAPSLL